MSIDKIKEEAIKKLDKLNISDSYVRDMGIQAKENEEICRYCSYCSTCPLTKCSWVIENATK